MTPWTVTRQAHLSIEILEGRILECVAMSSSRESSQPSDQTQDSCLAGELFTIWITRKAQEYWSRWPMPSLGFFPTQESNWSLPHCRQILSQLSYQGTPLVSISQSKSQYLVEKELINLKMSHHMCEGAAWTILHEMIVSCHLYICIHLPIYLYSLFLEKILMQSIQYVKPTFIEAAKWLMMTF